MGKSNNYIALRSLMAHILQWRGSVEIVTVGVTEKHAFTFPSCVIMIKLLNLSESWVSLIHET